MFVFFKSCGWKANEDTYGIHVLVVWRFLNESMSKERPAQDTRFLIGFRDFSFLLEVLLRYANFFFNEISSFSYCAAAHEICFAVCFRKILSESRWKFCYTNTAAAVSQWKHVVLVWLHQSVDLPGVGGFLQHLYSTLCFSLPAMPPHCQQCVFKINWSDTQRASVLSCEIP